METQIVDGKKISLEIKEQIIETLASLKDKNLRKPKLVIFYIGFNASSELYIKYKTKFANECGIDVEVIKFNDEATFQEIKQKIEEKNNDHSVDGIMIQLPINGVAKTKSNELVELINPLKDVDGLTPLSLGYAWFSKDYNFASSTALAVMKILKKYDIDLIGKNVVIIGSSIVLGRPLAGMIANEQATVSVLNSNTIDLKFYTKNADIIISATGKKKLLTSEMVKKDSILIDVGTNKDEQNKTHGDFEISEMTGKAKLISPSPGGVGPVTISMLIKNTVESYLKNIKDKNAN